MYSCACIGILVPMASHSVFLCHGLSLPPQNMVPGLYDPLGFSSKKTPEQLARGRSVEIKNGRLAMIGFAGLWAEASISGSVPFQPDC